MVLFVGGGLFLDVEMVWTICKPFRLGPTIIPNHFDLAPKLSQTISKLAQNFQTISTPQNCPKPFRTISKLAQKTIKAYENHWKNNKKAIKPMKKLWKS